MGIIICVIQRTFFFKIQLCIVGSGVGGGCCYCPEVSFAVVDYEGRGGERREYDPLTQFGVENSIVLSEPSRSCFVIL
jgi:hypothetical protein